MTAVAGRAKSEERAPRYRLYDMHCHLDRIADAAVVARDAEALGLALFCAPVCPDDSERAKRILGACPNVRIGAGLHPWWIDDGSRNAEDAARAASMAARSRWVGEVGLDFGRVHVDSCAEQFEAFKWICQTCAERAVDGRVFSIHAVHAAGEVLDVLERFGLTGHAACVFHWFSGTSDELARARRLGCYFSVNEMMLATRKGREYARQLPEDRLLLETDYPPKLDTPCPADQIAFALERTLDQLAGLRGSERAELAALIAQTSSRLLDL